MSDGSVWLALRSAEPLVVVEAPAGCGKTHQGADYAREVANEGGPGRPLILTHTHAACSVFSERTKGTNSRVDIRTIDSVIGQIASIYHQGLGLPADTATWVRQHSDGHQQLALKVAKLLRHCPSIAAAVAQRHPIVICDEHQDSSGDQHSMVMSLHGHGARLRIFADPMQRVFRDNALQDSYPPCDWDALGRIAQVREQLDYPHRWDKGCSALGQWSLKARELLKANGRLDLRSGLPESVRVVFVANRAQRNLGYLLSKENSRPIHAFEKAQDSLLILTRHNATARSLRAFFHRRISLWEGHSRRGLDKLVEAARTGTGDRVALGAAVVAFMKDVGKGFSPSGFGNAFEEDVRDGCTKSRNGKPRLIQELARCLVDDPSHRGVARVLERLREFTHVHASFAEVKIDCCREFSEAIRLGAFGTPEEGLAEITHRRTFARPKPMAKAISNIYRAKGLECDSVILMPCDGKAFPDTPDARCLLYVALSRATRRLLIVVSSNDPSPLLIV